MGAAAESYDYHLERANAYFKVSDFEKAYLSAHEATLLELRRPEAWLLMARAAAGRVDWDKEWKRRTDDTVCWEHCEWCFKEALVHADADTNSNLAYYYWQLGRGMSAFFSPHRDKGLKAQRFAEAGQYLNTALTLYREQLDSNPDDFGRFVELRFATIDLVENHLRLNRFRGRLQYNERRISRSRARRRARRMAGSDSTMRRPACITPSLHRLTLMESAVVVLISPL